MPGTWRTGRQGFAECFAALVRASALAPEAIARRPAGPGRSTIYDWMRGQHLPEDEEQFAAVVRECLAAAGDADLGALPTDAGSWLGILRSARGGTAGKPIGAWDPVKLHVHRAVGGSALPAYVARGHDRLLWKSLDGRCAANRLLVLRGGSSVGKSRTAFEAVRRELPDWWVLRPADASELSGWLSEGIHPQTVLWLDDLHDYAETRNGRQALARLDILLRGAGQVVVLASLWPELWQAYVPAQTPLPGVTDRYKAVRNLLTPLDCLTEMEESQIDPSAGGVLDVPEYFTDSDLDRARLRATETGDRTLADAIECSAAGGATGAVAQYLAGVPDLLEHYEGRAADVYGRAVITAAIDATRFGHVGLLSKDLVLRAAEGYLPSRQRAVDPARWREKAFTYATRELKGTVRALEPVAHESRSGAAGYRVADYLHQHGRKHLQASLGKASLWDALAEGAASPEDLSRLADAARRRGLYRHAARLARRAVIIKGDVGLAAGILREIVGGLSAASSRAAARWLADRAAVDDPAQAAFALDAFLRADEHEDCAALAMRAAEEAGVEDPWQIAYLIDQMRAAGQQGAITALAERALLKVSLGDSLAVAALLRALREAGALTEFAFLAIRAANWADLGPSWSVASLFGELQLIQDREVMRMLTGRVAADFPLDDPGEVAELVDALREAGEPEAIGTLADRAAAQVAIDESWALGSLLRALREAGQHSAISALLARGLADHVPIDHSAGIALLIRELRAVGADPAVTALLARDPGGSVPFDHPRGIAALLDSLLEAGASAAVTALLARDPARNVPLRLPEDAPGMEDMPDVEDMFRAIGRPEMASGLTANTTSPVRHRWGVAVMMRSLREADAEESARVLAHRAASEITLHNPRGVADMLRELREADEGEATAALLARQPARHALLDSAPGIGRLLRELRAAGADEAVTELLARDPARHVSLDSPVFTLLDVLQEFAASDAARRLAQRGADAGAAPGSFPQWVKLLPQTAEHNRLARFGREPDGSPAAVWSWSDLD